MQAELKAATEYLKQKGVLRAETGIILGTGLHHLSSLIDRKVVIPYSGIPGFCRSTVESHSGNLIYGTLGNKNVIALQGRFHYYEGYTFEQITFPVSVLHAMGINHLFVSNAAGSLHPEYRKGELMLIKSHLDFQVLPHSDMEPLRAESESMYDAEVAKLMKQVATEEGLLLHTGCYASVSGPQLETRAEYRFLRKMGADAVGMSTIPEVKEANRLKIPCTAVSVLTDECDPDNLKPVTLAEIIEVASTADKTLTRLINKTISLC